MVDVATPGASLLPQVENLREVSATVAVAVAERAARENLARAGLKDPVQTVRDAITPHPASATASPHGSPS